MFHTEDDSPSVPIYDNFESLAERRKLRPVMKSKNICFKRSRGQLHINNLSTSTTTDLSRSNMYYKTPSEDLELKLTLMNLIPRNVGQETSEGVQELIKHVSEFIEKKNPFRGGSSSWRKEKDETVCPSSRHSMRSPTSKDSLHSNQKPKTTSGDRKASKSVQNAAGKSFRDTVVSPKAESKSKPPSYANRRCVETKKRLAQPEPKCESMEGNETGAKFLFKTNQNSATKETTEKTDPPTERRATKAGYKIESGKSPNTKKLKPSEIPLRKNRKDVSKTKQASHVTTKTVIEGNVTTPAHVNTNRKSGANTNREIQANARETDKENIESSSTRQTFTKDKIKTTDKNEEKCDTDNSRDIHLNRSVKNPNIPELSNHPPKVRMLDLEQVRSSTFTVLTSLSNTLHRLESIHQQNIGLKENGSDRILGPKPSKLKILTPKSSFSILKAKGSKKSLSSRLSSKGNKPGLKNKGKESKTEVGTNRPPTFQGNTKTESREGSRGVKILAKPISSVSDVPRPKNQTIEREKQNPKPASAKVTSGTSRGFGFSRLKAISPKAASPRSQGGVGTVTGFNQKLLASLCHYSSDKPEGNFKSLHKHKDPSVKNKTESSNPVVSKSAPNSESFRSLITPPNRKKSDAVIIEKSAKPKPALPVLIEDQQKYKNPEAFKSESKTKTRSGDQAKVKRPRVSSKTSIKDLKVVGTAIKLLENGTPHKPEESETEKVKLRITIDVNSQEDCSFLGKNTTEDVKNVCSFNWLLMNHLKRGRECEQQLNETNESEQQEMTTKKEVIKEPPSPQFDDVAGESVTDELTVSKELETRLEQHYRDSQMMKRRLRPKYKTPVITIERKTKARSGTGSRWLRTHKARFNTAINFQNKMSKSKADTKLRSGFTRSFNRDSNIGSERRDHFDDSNSTKLKRRNSEPFSLRGFIWRPQDAVPPRGNIASASSLASSLKHLNTDDLEDFIFWESVPPRVTSCWETSLYHFKRPWSVLSCSVFKDNRLSNTPGLILENIRNGNSLTRRYPALQETERVSNSFDVEPSITQKNIDVRNWVAALNFQSPPSTSSDVIREGSVSPQTVTHSQNFKIPVVQKRRKIYPNLKQSDSIENKKSKESDKYNSEGSDIGLMELIRRKSGGFVTAEQYFNTNPNRSQSYTSRGKSNPRHKSKLNFQVLEDLEDSDVEKVTKSEPHIPTEEKMIQVAFDDFVSPPSSCPSVELLDEPPPSQDEKATPPQDSQSQSPTLNKVLRDDTKLVTFNVWKYLFMVTLFVLVMYYVSRSSHFCCV